MSLFTLCTAQAEGALLLWSKDRIDRIVLGFEVPIEWFLAFPALLVLLLAPLGLALLLRSTPPRFIGVVTGLIVSKALRISPTWFSMRQSPDGVSGVAMA